MKTESDALKKLKELLSSYSHLSEEDRTRVLREYLEYQGMRSGSQLRKPRPSTPPE